MDAPRTIKAVVTDIEGTTGSIAFVKDVLFPHARQRMADFVRTHGDEPRVRPVLEAAKHEAGDPAMDDAAIVGHLVRWIDEDRKLTPLKTLQGMIWEVGYRNGDFQGHIYEDAWRQLVTWKARGIRLFVYSSGSIAAQKLLFAHTAHGDLTRLFEGYFDTTTGPKKESESYRRIARAIGLPGEAILFLSDSVDELDAARVAGLRTTQLVRPGTASAPDHPKAATFDDVTLA